MDAGSTLLDAYRADIKGVLFFLGGVCAVLLLYRGSVELKADRYRRALKQAIRRSSVRHRKLLHAKLVARKYHGDALDARAEVARLRNDNHRLRGVKEKLSRGLIIKNAALDKVNDELRTAQRLAAAPPPVLVDVVPDHGNIDLPLP